MEKEYYIVVNENREGPFSLQHLAERGIEPSTLVWTSGLTDWTRADAIPELGALLQNQIADNESAFGGYARQEEPVRPPYKHNDQYGPYNNYGQPNNMPQAPATNWKTLSIIATVCGFIFSCIGGIVGIFAIVQAGKAENAMRCGDSFTAANCWSTCKTLCIISFVLTGLGLIANVFYISQLQKLGYGFL